ncbi:hypothetical protein B0J17DRAFT_630203 [Rhizoctonia solani]|nr:hypothetical protein B0J17DRAFT_630203 [Rhizoctonia solani]
MRCQSPGAYPRARDHVAVNAQVAYASYHHWNGTLAYQESLALYPKARKERRITHTLSEVHVKPRESALTKDWEPAHRLLNPDVPWTNARTPKAIQLWKDCLMVSCRTGYQPRPMRTWAVRFVNSSRKAVGEISSRGSFPELDHVHHRELHSQDQTEGDHHERPHSEGDFVGSKNQENLTFGGRLDALRLGHLVDSINDVWWANLSTGRPLTFLELQLLIGPA